MAACIVFIRYFDVTNHSRACIPDSMNTALLALAAENDTWTPLISRPSYELPPTITLTSGNSLAKLSNQLYI